MAAMQLTAEITLYPLQDDYIGIIEDLIHGLRRHDGLQLVTNAMSTQVTGDFDTVFRAVATELRASAERYGDQAMVCKFLPKGLDIVATPQI